MNSTEPRHCQNKNPVLLWRFSMYSILSNAHVSCYLASSTATSYSYHREPPRGLARYQSSIAHRNNIIDEVAEPTFQYTLAAVHKLKPQSGIHQARRPLLPRGIKDGCFATVGFLTIIDHVFSLQAPVVMPLPWPPSRLEICSLSKMHCFSSLILCTMVLAIPD